MVKSRLQFKVFSWVHLHSFVCQSIIISIVTSIIAIIN